MATERSSRGLVLALIAVGALVVATAIALVATTRSTEQAQADLARTTDDAGVVQTDLTGATTDVDAKRAELATLLDRLQGADDYLGLRTDARNQISESLDKTRSELYTLSGVLRTNQVRLYFQEKQAADLDNCITKANQALNVLSHGDKDAGRALLADSNKGCQAVNEYLASVGAQQ